LISEINFYFCTKIDRFKKTHFRTKQPNSFYVLILKIRIMYWTLELAKHLEDAPWPATKDELIDFGIRSGAPMEVIENLQEIEDEGEIYESIEEIWPDYPTKEDFFFNEDEY
jgi:hypothetical protein